MWNCKKIILFATLLSTGSPWVLRATHTNVFPNLTDDVTLRCYCERAENPTFKMDQLTRIRLLKRNNTENSSNWMTLAEISSPKNSSARLPQPVTSEMVTSGHLGSSDNSFLLVTWPTTSDDVIGVYQCEVDGFGGKSRMDVHFSTQTVTLTSLPPTTTELVEMMIKMKHDIQSKIEDNFLEVRYWPNGNYALLSPVSGCPDTPYTKMVRVSANITTDTRNEPNNSLSSPNHFHPNVFERYDTRNLFHFRLCRNSATDDQALLWPKGSYCIHGYNSNACPLNFIGGYVSAHLESSTPLGGTPYTTKNSFYIYPNYADVVFCCRNDGDPKFPMLLPNENPFYLFRYHGRCQTVRNMDVSEEWIQLNTGTLDTVTGTKPDGKLNDVVFRMCYYKKQK